MWRSSPTRVAALALSLGLSLGLIAAAVALRWGGEGPWWLEAARYLPAPWLLAPAAVAVVLAWRGGRPLRVLALAALVLTVVGSMGLEWRVAPAPAAPTLRLVTWNVKAEQAKERPGGLDALSRELRRLRPDVLVMQDANAMRRLPAPLTIAGVLGLPNVFAQGQFVVASRDGIAIDCRPGDDPGLPALARCRVAAPQGAFDLVTTHLESPRAGLVAARREGPDGIDAWERNAAVRLQQARALAARLAGPERPLVVAGDFNAPGSSPVLGAFAAAGLRDAFAEAGRGFGYTYGHTQKPAFSFLRIDHVLMGPAVQAVACEVGGADVSDHRPVVAELAFGPAARR